MLHRGHGIRLDNPDIVDARSCELSEHPRDGGLVNLEGQHIGLRASLRHRNERLAAARPDLHDECRVTAESVDEIQ